MELPPPPLWQLLVHRMAKAKMRFLGGLARPQPSCSTSANEIALSTRDAVQSTPEYAVLADLFSPGLPVALGPASWPMRAPISFFQSLLFPEFFPLN